MCSTPSDQLTPAQIAGLVDHTFLMKPDHFDLQARANLKNGDGDHNSVALFHQAFQEFLSKTIDLYAGGLAPFSICLYPECIPVARDVLSRQGYGEVRFAAVIGFPDGNLFPTAAKVSQTVEAIKIYGASEIDFVIAYERLKEESQSAFDDVLSDMSAVVQAAATAGRETGESVVVKVIIEESQIVAPDRADPYGLVKKACELASESGVDFVKTSTGFALPGATLESVRVMRANFQRGVKVSGGVNQSNAGQFLLAASGTEEVSLDPNKVRIGASSLLPGLLGKSVQESGY